MGVPPNHPFLFGMFHNHPAIGISHFRNPYFLLITQFNPIYKSEIVVNIPSMNTNIMGYDVEL